MNLLYRAIFEIVPKDAEGDLLNLALRSILIFSIIVSMLFFPLETGIEIINKALHFRCLAFAIRPIDYGLSDATLTTLLALPPIFSFVLGAE